MAVLKAEKIIDAINKGIALNPTEIEINQTKKAIVDGALEEIPIKKTIKVLIYLEDSSNQIVVDSKTQGTSYSTNRYKMIADKDADIEISPLNAIEFECLEGRMQIAYAYPIKIQNKICGYMCDLKKVS